MDDIGQDWLALARNAFRGSTTYFDSSIRRQIEQDLRQFQSEHPLGSKYMHDAYRLRSRLFRPKTRGSIRKNEAVAAEALFATQDVLTIKAQNESDLVNRASAALWQEVMQHRLTKTIPWFLISLGAYQEAQAVGVVCSHQSWDFNPAKRKDGPQIELIPPENLRIDPGAKWYDPINSSPYVIHMMPMYVKDVRARMAPKRDANGELTQAPWKEIASEKLLKATAPYADSTRQIREGPQRQDPKGSETTTLTDFTIVWVHRNIIEIDGIDLVFYTLADIELLSEPAPLTEEIFHGGRPYVMGFCALEAHKLYPGGVSRLTKDTQVEINDVANLRLDNVRFVLNKRYFVQRNTGVDLRALTRNAPGSAVLMDDPGTNGNVRVVDYHDVTGSAYQEQDRLNIDFDEIAGAFSPASVQSNRRLNETVGGMNILTKNANQVQAYQLKTWVETWAEPVLRQILLLEQHYESDMKILALAGEKARLVQKFGMDTLTDQLLMSELTLSVGVGMGATNPAEIIDAFLTALQTLRELLSDGVLEQRGLVLDEVVAEVFGKLGYSDGKRFFDTSAGDMRTTTMQNMIADLQQRLEAKQPPDLIQAQIRKLEAEIRAMEPKARKEDAAATKSLVEASYSAMQAGQVAAEVPQVAPVADGIVQWASGQEDEDEFFIPETAGIASGMPSSPLVDPRTGIGAKQPTAGVGEAAGIETPRADGVLQ